MKINFFAATLLSTVFISAANAQNTVPQKVKTMFEKEHPGVTHAKWERENGNFEGNWKNTGVDHSALYSPDGKFIMSEADIEISMLPKAVITYMTHTVQKKIKEASKNTDAAGTITYEADVKDLAYLFDANGKFIKTAKND